MASPSESRDRLSDLPDDVLGHVLSFLPNKLAGRAAALSRRWRHIFSSVDTVSFEEADGARASDQTSFYSEAKEKKSCSAALLDDVWSALLCRRRCGDVHVPLRRFRVAFDSCHGWNKCHLDQWLSYVLRHSRKELHLDLCFRLGPICAHGGDHDTWRMPRARPWYELPRRLFSCTAMRSLCLSYCRLNLPTAIDLPFVDTLRLTSVDDCSGSSIHRLIASCPCLVDLTLEANNNLEKVSVLDRPLRRFALRCCHSMKSVDIDASELRSLDYRGMVPAESLLSLHLSPEIIPSCTVDFCKVLSGVAEHARIRTFLEELSDAKRLHLHHRCLPARSFEGFPSFPNLTHLVLQGPLQSPDVVLIMLKQTPNLEVLSLLMEVTVVSPWACARSRVAPSESPSESSFSVPCLRSRVREINMVHYQGSEAHGTMARLLLRNALVLERMCVVLVKGSFELQARMKKEIESYIVATNVDKIFL